MMIHFLTPIRGQNEGKEDPTWNERITVMVQTVELAARE